jgi:hypothetical protein
VAPTLPDHLKSRNFGRGCRLFLLGESIEVEKRRTLDALRAAAESQPHQLLDVGLLLLDGRPQLGDGREQLGDHLFEDAGIVREVRWMECGPEPAPPSASGQFRKRS